MNDSLQVASAALAAAAKQAPLFHNFTLLNVLLFALSLLAYFLLEFKSMSTLPSFSWGFWIKDNWYNLAATICIMMVYFIYKPEVSPETAIMLGLSPNLVLDWAATLMAKGKKGGL